MKEQFEKYKKSVNPEIPVIENRVHAKVFSQLDAHSVEGNQNNLLSFAKFMKLLTNKNVGIAMTLIVMMIVPISIASLQSSAPSQSTNLSEESMADKTLNDDLVDIEKEIGDLQVVQDNLQYYGSNDDLEQPNAAIIEDSETVQAERVQDKDGYIYLKTRHVEKVFNNISEIPNKFGGYISESTYQGENAASTIEFRVPVEKFDEAVKFVQDQGGEILALEINATDKQNEVNEIDLRIKRFEDNIEELKKELESAPEEDKESIQNTIDSNETLIESAQVSLDDLKSQSAFSDLSIRLAHDDSKSIINGDLGVITETIETVLVFWGSIAVYAFIPAVIVVSAYKAVKRKK